jgi:hypothetical protein
LEEEATPHDKISLGEETRGLEAPIGYFNAKLSELQA